MAEIDMTKPQPCTKYVIAHYGERAPLQKVYQCIKKIEQEVSECFDAWRPSNSTDGRDRKERNARIAEELTDVVTAAITAMETLGYDEQMRGEVQRLVNEKNKARGYF